MLVVSVMYSVLVRLMRNLLSSKTALYSSNLILASSLVSATNIISSTNNMSHGTVADRFRNLFYNDSKNKRAECRFLMWAYFN